MNNLEVVNGDLLVTTGTEALADRVVVIENRTLVLPALIREQMRDLDNWVASGKYSAEIFAVGLSKTNQDRIEVVELIAPDPEKIFRIDGFFITPQQKELQYLLSDCQTLAIASMSSGIFLYARGIEGTGKGIFFEGGANGSIEWSIIARDLSQLFDQELPTSVEEARSLTPLEAEVDLDGVMTLSSASITRGFLKKVDNRAQEVGLKIGYTVHHHPSLQLAVLALRGKDFSRRQAFYDELLTYSPGDIDTMKRLGADFFEIRALGNPQNPFDPNVGVTSRIYRTGSSRID